MKFVRIVVGIVAVTTLAACGSSSKSSSSNGTSSGGSSTGSAASGAPIKIGNVGSYSGPFASSLSGAEQSIKAWADSVNAAGGIGGHPVQLIVKDDAGSATTALLDVKSMVESDHVVAIVADQSIADQSFATYLKGVGVPVVGGITISTTFATDPLFFPSGSNAVALNYAGVSLAKKAGSSFGYLYCAEAPTCRQTLPLYQALGKEIGVKFGYSSSVSATAPDYTAVCQGLKQSGVSSYFISDGSDVSLRIVSACKQQGVTAKFIPQGGVVGGNWASVAALDGVTGTDIDFQFASTATPAAQAYQAALAKYAPNIGTLNNPSTAYSWVAGELFEKAVEASGANDVTSASVIKGLYSLHDETLGGLAPPLNFTQGAPNLKVNCAFEFGISGGKFTSPNGTGATICAPESLVQSLSAKP